ncbi:unnamed protein product [Ilex paraguariensis]|uniref:B box-type domain-containing protein n=1 Tax=Ilex paraguariensis TaxID=185542 RepID=A0ABC8QNQ0_9AQUA
MWIRYCRIIQEAVGYFFCLEDRALFCRKCDITIHGANSYVSAHQRFLLTGVKVGLEPTEPGASTSPGKSHSGEKMLEPEARTVSGRVSSMSSAVPYNKVLPVQVGGVGDFIPTKLPFAGGSGAGSIPLWQLDENFGLTDFNQNFGYMDAGSSKADSGKLGDSDCSSILRAVEEELDSDECFGQVPEAFWAVPQIPSPPTASGLYWPKNYQYPSDTAACVPDICCSPSPMQSLHRSYPNGTSSKRRRQF